MPPITPSALRAQAAAVAGRFYDFPACAQAIRNLLDEYADRSWRASPRVAGAAPARAYQTPAPVLRQLVAALRDLARVSPEASLGLIAEIWAGGSLEEQRLAAELLGLVAPSIPAAALALLESWLPNLKNVEATDLLARYGLGSLALADPNAHLERAQLWIVHRNKWVRRLALVSLAPLIERRDWDDIPGALNVARAAIDDPDPELRNTAVETLRALHAKSPDEIFIFLREQAARNHHHAHLVVRALVPQLTLEQQAALLKLMRG